MRRFGGQNAAARVHVARFAVTILVRRRLPNPALAKEAHMSRWNKTRTVKVCNTFPDVWAAIVGCTGNGTHWRNGAGHSWRHHIEYACETCRAAKDLFDGLVGPAHQAALREAQDKAGVADYRVAEVTWCDGRPVLTGKVSVRLAREAADRELYERDMARAAKALRVYHDAGGDCRFLVQQHKLTEAETAALRAHYRAA
jgi:hypothetical protein